MLRDNKLSKVPPLRAFIHLTMLDVSFNEMTSLEGLSDVTPTLKELYLSKNDVERIEEIEHLVNLRVLELGSNKIRVCFSLPTRCICLSFLCRYFMDL